MVGDPRRQIILVGADHLVERLGHVAVGGERIVGGEVAAREDPDPRADRLRRAAAVLQGLPGRFQQHPVLRLHAAGFPRTEAEQAGVEQLVVVVVGRGPDPVAGPGGRGGLVEPGGDLDALLAPT